MRGYICYLLCRNKDEESKVSKGCKEINEMIQRNTNKQDDDEAILMKNMEPKNVEENENKGGACGGSTMTTTATIESKVDSDDDDNIDRRVTRNMAHNGYEL